MSEQQHSPPPASGKAALPRPTESLKRKVLSIRVKLTLLTMVLIALITTASSMVVIQNMDRALHGSLVRRGAALAQSAAIPAGYSILANDRLALDNLAAKIVAAQDDILYLAIIDQQGEVLAHSALEETGSQFQAAEGAPLERGAGFAMYRVERHQRASYEFQAPISFAESPVGSVVIGIDVASLAAAKDRARGQTLLISLAVLLVGALGTFLLSRLFTAPIERLAAGVSQITAGDYQVEVRVTSRDELGELTRSFNSMSQVIMSQKDRLEGYAQHLEDAYISTVRILAAALDARDNYTLGHSARVARLSQLIGQRLGLAAEELKDLEIACFLHDIGKIHVPDHILNKPTPLDQAEHQVIKRHPEQGADILNLAVSLHKYIPVVLHHHEWFNGRGYPRGLKGDEIHLHAQIVAIADSYDAMTSSRPYRKGCTRDEATAEILRFGGIQFNPELVDRFLEALDDFQDDHALFPPGGPHATHHFLHTAADGSDRLWPAPGYRPEQEPDNSSIFPPLH